MEFRIQMFKIKPVRTLLYSLPIIFIVKKLLQFYHSVSYNVQPMPSAGIVPMLQALCPGGVTNDDGFREQPRAP